MLPWRLAHVWRSALRVSSLHTSSAQWKHNDSFESLGRWGDAQLEVLDKFRLHVMTATNLYDTSEENIRRTTLIRQRRRFRRMQMISQESLDRLGVDVAVAEMVLRLGGAIRFEGADRWLTGTRTQLRRRALLPRDMVLGPNSNYRLETIDLSNCPIMYEGLSYIRGLHHLRHLALRNCAFVDDHCLGLMHHLRRSLLLLDLSLCPNVSSRGLAALWSLHSLRRLNVEGMSTPELAEDRELVCVLLEERNPNLFIAGVDYQAALETAHRQETVMERAKNFRERLVEAGETTSGQEVSGKAEEVNQATEEKLWNVETNSDVIEPRTEASTTVHGRGA